MYTTAPSQQLASIIQAVEVVRIELPHESRNILALTNKTKTTNKMRSRTSESRVTPDYRRLPLRLDAAVTTTTSTFKSAFPKLSDLFKGVLFASLIPHIWKE